MAKGQAGIQAVLYRQGVQARRRPNVVRHDAHPCLPVRSAALLLDRTAVGGNNTHVTSALRWLDARTEPSIGHHTVHPHSARLRVDLVVDEHNINIGGSLPGSGEASGPGERSPFGRDVDSCARGTGQNLRHAYLVSGLDRCCSRSKKGVRHRDCPRVELWHGRHRRRRVGRGVRNRCLCGREGGFGRCRRWGRRRGRGRVHR